MKLLIKILKKEVVYIASRSEKRIVFNLGLYIVVAVGFFLAWYLTNYVVYNLGL